MKNKNHPISFRSNLRGRFEMFSWGDFNSSHTKIVPRGIVTWDGVFRVWEDDFERCMGRNCFVLYKSYISSHETVCFESERNLRWSFLTVTWTILDSLYMNNCTRQMGRFIHVLWDDKRPSYVPILVRCISGFESSHKTLRFEYVRVTNDLPMDR